MTKWLSSAHDLPEQLVARLVGAHECPQRRGLSPAMSYGRHNGPPRSDARQAAVLMLLYPNHGQWHLPLTRRQDFLSQHGGQISLPGGALEAGETPAQAALREAHEELGIIPTEVELINSLFPVYVFNSNFFITPWVAVSRREMQFRPNPSEVAEVIELPLDVLLKPEDPSSTVIRRGRLEFSAPSICWQGSQIWGATHVILGEFGRILRAKSSPGETP